MSEYSEQCALFEWAERMSERLPELRLLFAVPNGEKRDKVTGARLKRMGVKPGVPDTFLCIPRRYGKVDWHGLAVEMKAKGGRQSPEQKEWERLLQEQGYLVVVAFDWWTAARMIICYLGRKPADFGLDRPALDAAVEMEQS